VRDDAAIRPVIAALVPAASAPGTPNDPSLQLMAAWLAKQQALESRDPEQRSMFFTQSLEHYERLDEATQIADPYGIRSPGLCGASDTYLRAAFWTSIARSDEAVAPPPASKYALLQKALEKGRAARSEPDRVSPEGALLAEAHALEDLAYYYKETERYAEAAEAFEKAVAAIGPGRSKAYTLMSEGRCRFRWAMDAAAIDGDPALRAEQLAKAHAALRFAVEQARDDQWNVAAEARVWLGYVLRESALHGPGSLEPGGPSRSQLGSSSIERLKGKLSDKVQAPEAREELARRMAQLQLAWKHAAAGAELARPHSLEAWSKYLFDSAEFGGTLVRVLEYLGPNAASSASLSDVRREVCRECQALLDAAQHDSAALPPRRVRASFSLKFNTLPAADRETFLTTWTPLFARTGDAWQAELSAMYMLSALQGTSPIAWSAAMQTADGIADAALRSQTRASILAAWAGAQFAHLKKQVAAREGVVGRFKSEDDRALKQIEDRYAEALAEGAAALDPATAENLRRLLAEPLATIESGKWGAGLGNFERYRLREAIGATLATRSAFFDVLDTRLALHARQQGAASGQTGLAGEARLVSERILACLKPVLLSGDGQAVDMRLLHVLETKLAEP
jgi:tetratricopeptide (TPR) repeat protein